MRQIILDTETTGLFPQQGDRIVEIACIEMVDGKRTGKYYQAYVNPKRDSNPFALKVHGLTTEFLADKPFFENIADNFLQFVAGAELLIHNAPFDIGFINNELQLMGNKPIETYCSITDTKSIARSLYTNEFLTKELITKHLVEDESLVKELRAKFPNEQDLCKELANNTNFRVHSLDHLCKYYDVSLTTREQHHGALIDCELLARVYFHLQQEQNKKLQISSSIAHSPYGSFSPKSQSPQKVDVTHVLEKSPAELKI